jgi:hypothetical protein
MQAYGNVKPAFEVHPLEGFVEQTYHRFDKSERDAGRPGLVSYKKRVPAGYMVYFPQGHSIRVGTEQELKRLNLHMVPHKIDMDSGEALPIETLSLKEQNTIHNRQARIVNTFADETEEVKEPENG